MIIQRSALLGIGTFALGNKLRVEVVDRITTKNAPFPAVYDPVGTIEHGNVAPRATNLTQVPILWEKFTVLDAVINVPYPLPCLVRAHFPGCRWDMRGGRLYAVKDGVVVAVIDDATVSGTW
jgi:hypothetical protein